MTSATLTSLDPRAVVAKVSEREYARLLGLGSNRPIEERFRGLADGALRWYAENGDPHVWTSEARIERLDGDRVHVSALDDARCAEFRSRRLSVKLGRANACGLIVAGVTAGPAIDEAASVRWPREPDEAWFLERLGATVVETLSAHVRTRFESESELADGRRSRRLLLPDAPGYAGWELHEQAKLMRFLLPTAPLRLTEGMMLAPKSSMLLAFGIAFADAPDREALNESSCSCCSLSACAFRRT